MMESWNNDGDTFIMAGPAYNDEEGVSTSKAKRRILGALTMHDPHTLSPLSPPHTHTHTKLNHLRMLGCIKTHTHSHTWA